MLTGQTPLFRQSLVVAAIASNDASKMCMFAGLFTTSDPEKCRLALNALQKNNNDETSST